MEWVIIGICVVVLAVIFMPRDFDTAFIVAWGIGLILTLAFWVGVFFVAAHFISKYW